MFVLFAVSAIAIYFQVAYRRPFVISLSPVSIGRASFGFGCLRDLSGWVVVVRVRRGW